MNTDLRDIQSERLRLVLFTEELLTHSLEAEPPDSEARPNFAVATDWIAESQYIRRRRDQLRADPTYAPWGPRAIVLRETNIMIGHIGFHAPPNHEHLATRGTDPIEFGYTIYPAYRRNGYATEAAHALMRWAMQTGHVQTFVVSIAPDNAPSQAIARRFGFTKVDEQIDPEDGLEKVFVLSAADFNPGSS